MKEVESRFPKDLRRPGESGSVGVGAERTGLLTPQSLVTHSSGDQGSSKSRIWLTVLTRVFCLAHRQSVTFPLSAHSHVPLSDGLAFFFLHILLDKTSCNLNYLLKALSLNLSTL